jgi:hypothetical protein
MSSTNPHEAAIEREFYAACWRTITHPSETPAFFRDLYVGLKDYYAGRDLENLSRFQLRELVVWTRRAAVRIAGSALMLCVVIVVGLGSRC